MKPRKELFTTYGRRPSYSLRERVIRYSLRTMAYLTIVVTLAIVVVLLVDSVRFFQMYPAWDFLTGLRWEPFGQPKLLGLWPLVTGTFMIAIGSCAIAVPLGVGTAIFLSQYASVRVRETIGPIVEILGGIPTVVYGYFALLTITPALRTIFPQMDIFNALSASIVVGIAILPMVSSLSLESMRLVPPAIRNAGYALGMRKFHVVVKITIPAAASGIVASVILAFARAIGETMAVALAAGSTPNMEFNYLKGIQTVTAYIVQVSLGDTPAGSIEYYTIYALGLTMFLIAFAFNFLASRIVARYREVYS